MTNFLEHVVGITIVTRSNLFCKTLVKQFIVQQFCACVFFSSWFTTDIFTSLNCQLFHLEESVVRQNTTKFVICHLQYLFSRKPRCLSIWSPWRVSCSAENNNICHLSFTILVQQKTKIFVNLFTLKRRLFSRKKQYLSLAIIVQQKAKIFHNLFTLKSTLFKRIEQYLSFAIFVQQKTKIFLNLFTLKSRLFKRCCICLQRGRVSRFWSGDSLMIIGKVDKCKYYE